MFSITFAAIKREDAPSAMLELMVILKDI